MADEEGYVTGLGGIFFKCRDRDKLIDWYRDKLGFPFDGAGSSFLFREEDAPDQVGYQVWGPFNKKTGYFRPSGKDYMVNLRVRGLHVLLERLKKQGIEQIGDVEEYDYGRFAWIIDPEGTKIELWEQIGTPPIVEGSNSTGNTVDDEELNKDKPL